MNALLAILAQTTLPADPLSNGGGWFGAGLLGLVLAWLLFKHLPAKDQQIKDLVDDKDARLDEQRKEFATGQSLAAAAFRKEAADERVETLKLLAAKDVRLDEQRKEFTGALNQISDTFRKEAAAERIACEKHFGALADAMNKGNAALMEAFRTMGDQVQSHAVRNVQWSEMLKAEVAKAEQAKAEAAKAQAAQRESKA